MRALGIVLAVAFLALAAWLAYSTHEPGGSASTSDTSTEPVEGPELHGLSEEAREALARKRAAEARSSEGAGGLDPAMVEGRLARVRGRIVGPDGKPVEDAELGTYDGDDGSSETYAEEDGSFEFDLEVYAPLQFVASAPRYRATVLPWRELIVGATIDLGTIVIHPGGRIHGRVVDQRGEPWEGLRVELAPDDDPVPAWWDPVMNAGAVVPGTETWEDGTFRFEGLPEGRYRVHIDESDAKAPAILEGIQPGAEALEIQLERAVPSDEEQGKPWKVKLRLLGAPWSEQKHGWKDRNLDVDVFGAWHRFSYSEAHGVVHAEVLGPGPVHFQIEVENSSLPPVIVPGVKPPGGVLDVQLPAPRILRGRVSGLPSDLPASVRVRLRGYLRRDGTLAAEPQPEGQRFGLMYKWARVKEDGRFELSGVPRGRAVVKLEGGAATLEGESKVVSTDGAPLELSAYAEPTIELRFHPPEGVEVHELLWRIDALDEGGTRWISSGEADREDNELRSLATLKRGLNDYRLTIRSTGRPVIGPITVPFRLGRKTLDVKLPAPRMLTGLVVDAEGRPMASTWVQVVDAHDAHTIWPVFDGPPGGITPFAGASTTTALDGSFALSVPTEGRWHLLVQKLGHAMREPLPVVVAGAKPVRVVMDPAARITGRLTCASDVGFGDYEVIAYPEGGGPSRRCAAEPGGFFELHSLSAGRYTLVVVLPEDELEYREFHGQAVVAGVRAGTRGVRIALKHGVHMALELVNEAGRALANAKVTLIGARLRRYLESHGEGIFRAGGVPPGAYRFEIRIEGREVMHVDAKVGETVRKVVR